jgi:membrane protein
VRERVTAAGVRLVERLRAVPPLHAFELAARRFLADGMTDRAASLAYYGLLSLLPSLMIAAAVLKLTGTDAGAADDFGGYLRDQGASTSLAGTVESVMQTAIDSAPEEASTIGLIGLGTLIYGASRVFAAAGRALDVIWRRRPEGLTVVRRIAGIGWTLALLVLALIAGVLTFVGRELFEDVLDAIGLSSAGATIWTIARWPVAAVAVMLAMRLVMWAAPSGPRERFRLVTPGALVAASAWFAASVGYGIYIGEISTYNSTYGAFAALVILLLWIWITSIAFLYGCEFDAVLAERRAAVSEPVAAGSTDRAGGSSRPRAGRGGRPRGRTGAEGP